MTVDISKTIKRLTEIINDKNCSRMNLSTVKGYLGELLIKQKLEEEGLEVLHHGNQSGFDLSIGNTGINIDVKTSLPKNEFKWNSNYWGWALLHENKKKELKATHIVCLGLNADCSPLLFIVIPIELIAQFPSGIKQFSKVKHSLFITLDNENSSRENNIVKECKSLLKINKIKTKMFNERIIDEIKALTPIRPHLVKNKIIP